MAKTCAATLAIFLAAGLSAEAQEMTYGQAEFLNSCAACHGTDGHGDGPMAEVLNTPPADLTRIAERNGGSFPYWKVFATIDGRYIVPGHGERDIPVWGRQFIDEDIATYGPSGGEIVTTERIHELTTYVETLQR